MEGLIVNPMQHWEILVEKMEFYGEKATKRDYETYNGVYILVEVSFYITTSVLAIL